MGGGANGVEVEVQAVVADAVTTCAVGLGSSKSGEGQQAEDAGDGETHVECCLWWVCGRCSLRVALLNLISHVDPFIETE